MSVIYKGDVNQGISITGSGSSATRKLVFFSENGETMNEVRAHSSFPSIGSKHPDDSTLFCTGISVVPSREGVRNKYAVTASYATRESGSGTSSGSSAEESIYGIPFNITMSAVENIVPFEFSYDTESSSGEPVCPVATSAGTAIAASTVKVSLQISFSYYLPYFNPSWILMVADTVNRERVKVCDIEIPAECGLIKTVGSKIIREEENSYYQVDVSMEINSDGFKRVFPDKSVYCRGTDGNPVRIYTAVDLEGNAVYGSDTSLASLADSNSGIIPVDEALWLDGSGNVQQYQNGTGMSPVFLSFKEKCPRSWSQLSLPQSAGGAK